MLERAPPPPPRRAPELASRIARTHGSDGGAFREAGRNSSGRQTRAGSSVGVDGRPRMTLPAARRRSRVPAMIRPLPTVGPPRDAAKRAGPLARKEGPEPLQFCRLCRRATRSAAGCSCASSPPPAQEPDVPSDRPRVGGQSTSRSTSGRASTRSPTRSTSSSTPRSGCCSTASCASSAKNSGECAGSMRMVFAK